MSDELDLFEAPESARPSDPGGEVLALRFMVNELGREALPELDWDRVELRLLARIEAGEADEASQVEGGVAACLPLASTSPIAEGSPSDTLGRGEVQGSKPSSSAPAVRSMADMEPLDRVGVRSGSGERARTRRGSSKVRARSFGLWAAATLVLVSAAAFAWFERGGAPTERTPDGASPSRQPATGSTGAPRAGGPGVERGSAGAVSSESGSAENVSADGPRAESEPAQAGFGEAAAVRSTLHAGEGTEPNTTSSVRESGAPPEVEVDAGERGRTGAATGGSQSGAAQGAEVVGLMSDAELASRVRSCLVARAPQPSSLEEGLERRIESSLSVRIEPDGTVGSVSFHPPLRPELQSCALFVLSLRLGGGPRELSVPIRLP